MSAERVNHGATRWSKVGGLILLGWFASSAYHSTLTASKAIKAVPALQAEAGCEHYRAETTKKLALQPTIVDPKALPRACAHAQVDLSAKN